MKYTRQDILEKPAICETLDDVELFILAIKNPRNKGFDWDVFQRFYGSAAFLNAFVKQNLSEGDHYEVYALKDAEERETYFEMLEVLHRTEFVMSTISKEMTKSFFKD